MIGFDFGRLISFENLSNLIGINFQTYIFFMGINFIL